MSASGSDERGATLTATPPEPTRGEELQEFVVRFWPSFRQSWQEVATSQ